MSTTITCPMCGRRDTLTGEAPHGRTLPQLHGWQIVDGRDVCGPCSLTDPATIRELMTFDTPFEGGASK